MGERIDAYVAISDGGETMEYHVLVDAERVGDLGAHLTRTMLDLGYPIEDLRIVVEPAGEYDWIAPEGDLAGLAREMVEYAGFVEQDEDRYPCSRCGHGSAKHGGGDEDGEYPDLPCDECGCDRWSEEG